MVQTYSTGKKFYIQVGKAKVISDLNSAYSADTGVKMCETKLNESLKTVT